MCKGIHCSLVCNGKDWKQIKSPLLAVWVNKLHNGFLNEGKKGERSTLYYREIIERAPYF